MGKESRFQSKVEKLLKSENCWSIKYWGGGNFTKSGIPDILACCNGCFIGIELKADNGKPSALQIYNLRKIEQSGGYAILLYPSDFELFKAFIEYLSKGFDKNAVYFYKELRKQLEKYIEKEFNNEIV